MTLEFLLNNIPLRTHNFEPFGLKMMPCNSNEWSVCYYSHFSSKSDDSKPHIVKDTLLECLIELYAWWIENHPLAISKLTHKNINND